MPATYTVRINGVDRAGTHVLLEGFKVNEITNGINTLVCEVGSEDASFRPLKRQTIEVEEDDGTSPVRLIFGGTLRMVRERGWGMTADGQPEIIQAVSADSYKTLASRRFVTETFSGGTLKSALQLLEPYLTAYGVSLDPAQVDGPTLDPIEWKVVRVDDALNFLATLTAKYGAPFVWTIDYSKILGMYQTGTVAAPWNVDESDFTTTESTFGDIEVEPTDDNYANKIIVVWGNGSVIDLGPDGLNTPETFTGDGVTNSFPLTYQLVGPIPPPPLTSPPTASAIGYAYVIQPGGTLGFLGNTGTFGAEWEYDQVTNSISRVAGAPPLGYVFTVPYRGLLTGEVTAQDAAEIAANGLWEDKILAPEIEDPVLAQSVANAELARRVNTGRIVRFRTRRMPAPEPGQSITITVPKRNISGSFTVTDVATENDPGNANTLYRTVTCNSTIHEQAHQTLTRWWSEKDTAGISQPAGASAVPDWPLNSVQFNDNWEFGGAAHVLYGDLFYSQPDAFTSPPEVQSKGLIFVQNQDIGEPGHIGLDDPQRLEMGMIGEGDFEMDLFGVDASILMNATGNIVITAGVPEISPMGSPDEGLGGSVQLVGNASITEYLAALSGIAPAIDISPFPFGDSHTRLHDLTVVEGIAGFYRTVSSLPFSIQVTGTETTNEFYTYVVTAGTGTIFLPWIGSAGTPNYRSFPNTLVGRMYHIVNDGGGTLTVDAGTAGTNINDASTITLADKASVVVQRHDDGWRILASFGTVTGGGAGGVTPGGNDKDVQFNDGGVLGGESAFEYDKTKDQLTLTRSADSTQVRVISSGSQAGMIGLIAGDSSSTVQFGWETIATTETAQTYAPAQVWFANAGGSGISPANDAIGLEINPGEDPESPMAFSFGRGIELSADGIVSMYQYGGLGSGSAGMGVYVQRNSDGAGAPGWLGLENQDGTPYYEWPDQEGYPHWGDFTPSEGASPSPADSNFMTIGNVPEMHIIVKEQDESIANDTLQDDNEFWFNINANDVWVFEMVLFVNSGTSNAPDIKWDFTLPSGATIKYGVQALSSASTAINGTQFIFGVTSAATPGSAGVLTTATIETMPVYINGTIRAGSAGGIVQFRWAQLVTTGGSPTVVRADSYLKRYRRATS